jgi:hypothetical protein
MLPIGQSGGMFWQQARSSLLEATRQHANAGAMAQNTATSINSAAFLPRFTMK